MNRHLNARKLHMESLEDRCLLAVVAGGEESATFADAAPHATLADDQMEFALVITDALPVAAEVENPRVSVGDGINLVTETPYGETVYVSLYVKSNNPDYGVQRGYCSLNYDAAGLTPVAYYDSPNFDSLTINEGFDFSSVGCISAFGGEPSDFGAAYGKDSWALVGTMSFSADVVGQYEFTTGVAVNSKGEERESWGFVREDFEDTYEYSIPKASTSLTITGEMPVIEDVAVEGWIGGYDGHAHSITITDPAAETDKILYSTDGVNYDLTVCPEYTEEGVYTTYVRVSRKGCAIWYGSTTVEIQHVVPVVTTLEDVVDNEDDVISLREAIERAIEGDVITFDASLAGGTIILNGTQLEITKGITIDASDVGGITIDANGQSRVFYTSGGTENNPIGFVGLTITGGFVGSGGAGIFNKNGIIVVANCNIVDNSARDSSGGGINSEGGSLTVTDSIFSKNSADGNGGGIWTSAILMITNSEFLCNTSYSGGGIYNYSSTLTVINSTIANNTADSGGGIFNESGTLTISDSTFLKNTACQGGGIYIARTTLTIENCMISENIATDGNGGGIHTRSYSYVTVTNSILTGNSAKSNGGGISNSYSSLTVINSTLSMNLAYGGGGIANFGDAAHSIVKLANSLLTENSADYGGGIWNNGLYTDSTTITINNSTIARNSAGSGGGIYTSNNMTVTINSIIAQNFSDTEWFDICDDNGIDNNNGVTINAYNTLSSFTGWTESTDCLVYDPAQPLFEDAENSDYTLAQHSQAVNMGDNSYVETETDLVGNPRIVNGTVDLGAYERQQLATTVMLTGTRGNYVSYGANRHRLEWEPVDNASEYELAYSTDGLNWIRIETEENFAIVSGLTYGDTVSYRVRALGEGVFIDADWSDVKSFDVCPMDINNDGMISGSDRSLMASAWGSELGDEKYRFCADINGDGNISGPDRSFLGSNWAKEAGDDDLVYPRAVRAVEVVFATYESGDMDADINVF